jgi:hypothetical protein
VGVREGDRVALWSPPRTWTTDALGVAARVSRRRVASPCDVVVAFVDSRARLDALAVDLAAAIAPDGMAWVAGPRRAAGHRSDLTDQATRDVLLSFGLVDVKVAMLDEDWSGMKYVWRRERRAELRQRR